MDHDSNTGDSLGRMPFNRPNGGYSVVPMRQLVPGIDFAYDNGSDGSPTTVHDAHPAARCDHIHGGCSSLSTAIQIGHGVTSQPLDHAETRQLDLPTHNPATLDWDTATGHQQASHRLLEDTDLNLDSSLDRAPCGEVPDAFWLPFFLRRTTSLLFLVWFALMAATLEVLFAVSQRHSGLSQGVPSIRYLWSYGTTGILTLTAALWHRLDYEAKVSAPWTRASPITTSKAALLIDYIDVWSVLVPLRAFRNKDYQVVYSSTVSLLLQALIVLSTALFTLSPTKLVNNAEPVVLTSRFVDEPARLKDTGSLLPYYITMGHDFWGGLGNLSQMMGDNLTHPEGCTNQFAYQTFYPVSSSLEEVETTVDGLALRLACETASVGKRVLTPQFVFDEYGSLNVSGDWPYFKVDYQGCETTIDWDIFASETEPGYFWVENNRTFRESWMVLRAVPGFTHQQCNSTDPAAHRLVLLSAEVEWRSTNRSIIFNGYEAVGVDLDASVSDFVALVCTPSLEHTLLDVSRGSGGVKSVSRHDGGPADPFKSIHPWDFIEFFFDEHIIPEHMSQVEMGNSTVCADIHSQAVLGLCGESCVGAPGLLKDAAFLQDILATFSADYAATTTHTMLTERVNIASTGTSSSISVRLWVQPIVCQAMVALLALLILITVGVQWTHQKKLTRSVNPGSIVSTMILAGKAASFTFPKNLGPASIEELRRALQVHLDNHGYSASCPLQQPAPMDGVNPKGTGRDAYPVSSRILAFKLPLPLQPVSQTALMLIITACGTTLMIFLQKSNHQQGLGDAENSKHLLFAWTTVPAAILTAISWWISAIDTQVRLLAPLKSLKTKCDRSVLRMDLLRGLVPLVLYHELKTSNFAAASTTLAALLGATLTTVSAAMFHVVTFPVSRPVELSQNTVFITPTPKPWVEVNDSPGPGTIPPSYVESGYLSSLILETNLSYPQGSYEELVFPEFSMVPLEVEGGLQTFNASSAIIKVTAPALRSRLSCHVYSPSEIDASYVRNQSTRFQRPWNGVLVNITAEACGLYSDTVAYKTAFFETGNLSEARFAAATNCGTPAIDMPSPGGDCSPILYIWGSHDTSLGRVTNISAVGCNNIVQVVDVTFALVGPDLSLDLSDAPAIDESTVRDIHGLGVLDSFDSNDLYEGLASLPITNHILFDPFFQQLVTSRYAIPVSAIGDPTQAGIVMDAIRRQHGTITAQFLNSNYRIDINSSTVMDNASAVLNPTLYNHSTSDCSARYSASVTYPFGRHRVVQDPTATAILEALLLAILILVAMGWYWGSREPLLPRSPTSVGSILALLAGGNVLEHLYDGGPEPLSWDDVKDRLGEDYKFYLGWDPSSTNEEFEQRRFGIWIIKRCE